ncbi:SdiA-regulated domain-containing protein [Microbulbifer sp. OS29]|uniref:SdiA-regulated domain-containing protein n=1 Tax=Microbulbifer okhotskensis TaxID=2926617 RepID=A0A9X2J5S9_9GAMM|nr:SdiA-regulated domain-containing protein [Microbulbifer okhotskensis]MCO1333900.1 SdiA-regulated domain-containing protein [Microbulbifer okhotskensis]
MPRLIGLAVIKRFFLGVAGALLSSIGGAAEIIPAKKVTHYWVAASAGLSISGLSFCAGNLLTVSDKDSKEIYKIVLEGRRAELETYVKILGLAVPKKGRPTNFWQFLLDLTRPAAAMDFEAISCGDNAIYILSERYNRIAEVDMQGRGRWLDVMWSPIAKAQGYLQGYNLSGVGLAKVGDSFWVALEREPRGLIKLGPKGEIQIFTPPSVSELDFRGEPENLSGLDYYDGALFTLEPNAYAVCRRALPSLKAEWCLDYREHENSSELGYEVARTGGKGDGLVVGEKGIFIVFDNDNISRIQDPQDRRALLLQLAFPEGAR